jgi:hypothetical protein
LIGRQSDDVLAIEQDTLSLLDGSLNFVPDAAHDASVVVATVVELEFKTPHQ